MSFFKKSEEEKYFESVIKNEGNVDNIVYLSNFEDFNNNSTLIVSESEEALFYKDGIIEEIFTAGKYKLTTENYPFISRIRNITTGGVSTCNCKIYYVKKAHSMEILWGTDSPIQVRDPIQKIATKVQARGSFKFQIENSKLFLIKLLGNNINLMESKEINLYFRNEFMEHIKANLAREIMEDNEEILGISAKQDIIANKIEEKLKEVVEEYGIKIINFIIAGIDILDSDPNRLKLEEAYASKRQDEIFGKDSDKLYGRKIAEEMANKSQGGIANVGMEMGIGMQTMNMVNNMTKQAFINNKDVEEVAKGKNTEESIQEKICSKCNAKNNINAKFCSECGTKFPMKSFCSECGAELSPQMKFCSECGTKVLK